MVLAAGTRTRRLTAGAARVLAGLTGTAVLLNPGWAAGPARAEAPPAAGGASPFWVDPDSRAARQADAWEARGRLGEAALLRRIAEQPLAAWVGDGIPDVAGEARRITVAAERAHRIPVLVAHNIPQRDCGRPPAGGATDAAAYRRWIARLADGIGDRPAVVILEPDAVPSLVTGCGGAAPAPGPGRAALLAGAVRVLKTHPGTRVYLDAGNPGWIPDPRGLAAALRLAGIGRADGFSLNVGSFHTTEASREYGDRLSGLLGGAHYVVDTGRNGKGPWGAVRRDAGAWCNPPDRALGPVPTVRTGSPLVDAYLWVKRPGESDGACRGAPAAGHWWSRYAVELAREAGRRTSTRASRPAPAVPTWTPAAPTPASPRVSASAPVRASAPASAMTAAPTAAPVSVNAPASASAPALAAVPSAAPGAGPSGSASPGVPPRPGR